MKHVREKANWDDLWVSEVRMVIYATRSVYLTRCAKVIYLHCSMLACEQWSCWEVACRRLIGNVVPNVNHHRNLKIIRIWRCSFRRHIGLFKWELSSLVSQKVFLDVTNPSLRCLIDDDAQVKGTFICVTKSKFEMSDRWWCSGIIKEKRVGFVRTVP